MPELRTTISIYVARSPYSDFVGIGRDAELHTRPDNFLQRPFQIRNRLSSGRAVASQLHAFLTSSKDHTRWPLLAPQTIVRDRVRKAPKISGTSLPLQ